MSLGLEAGKSRDPGQGSRADEGQEIGAADRAVVSLSIEACVQMTLDFYLLI